MCWPSMGQGGTKKEQLRLRYNFKVLSLPLQSPKQVSILIIPVQTLLMHRHGPVVTMSWVSIRLASS